MTTGGFKAFDFRITIQNSGNMYYETQVKQIIKLATTGIIQADPSWGYDTDYTADSDTFTKVGTSTSLYNQFWIQFLKNTVTNSKLAVMYCCHYQYNESYSPALYINTNNVPSLGAGLMMSMIPGGSSQTWDVSNACKNSTLIPNEAVLICGLSAGGKSAIWSASVGDTFRWLIIVKGDVLFCFFTNATYLNGFMIGKIYGVLSNDSDTGVCSQYGACCFRDSSYGENGTNGYLNSTTSNVTCGESECMFRVSTAQRPATGLMFSSGGASTQGFYTNSAAQSQYTVAPASTSKTLFGAYGRWLMCSDPTSYGITAGNGMKGYWDTDVIRYIYPGFSFGTLFDGGNFIHLGSGVVIGWDPSNTVALRQV